MTELYAHQRAAWEAAARGEHLVVTTGTASGKTLAFNLPVLDALARDPKHRALYLYPTKALAQDQFRALSALRVRLRPAIYDGDTPTEHRRRIRAWSNAILTNPDMVHIGLLPNHERWADVLSNLRYVVVDEAHVYRGVFGSHGANVLRRLRRLAAIYGSSPSSCSPSATIANPVGSESRLLGTPVTVIGDDAAPRAERTVVLWNPPLLDVELGLRGSALAEASKLQAAFVERGLRTLTFAKSRKTAELIHRFTADRLGDDSRLSPYRAGYTVAQRREIERRLAEGDLLGVTSTDALERGIDIGLLDAVISVGFPGTIASLRQQWGRAGRRGHGLAVLGATRGRSRPVLHARAGEAPRPTRRGRDPRPREPARPRGSRAVCRVRSPDRRERRGDPRTRGARGRRARSGAETHAARLRLGRDDDACGPDPAPLGRPGLVHRGRPDLRRRARIRRALARAYSTVHEGAIYLHLGEPYPRSRRSTRRRCTPSSSRSAATGTRSRRRRRTRT